MTKPKIRTSVSICKGDTNSRQICITLVSSGVVYEIPDNSIAVLLATKPDGKKVYNDCSINGNEIIFDVTTQLIASSGDVECQVELSDAEGTILTSPAFVIRVYEKLLDNSVMESINEYKALTAFCTNAENAAVRAENNAEQIEEQLKATGKLLSEKEEAINVLANKTVQASGNANSSAEDAQNFAVSAGEYASEAKDYAERLQLDVTQLSNYVASARQSAENASAYADVAINNKTASDTSASNAATSERNAKASETAAKQYEESSSEKLNLCIDYADEASEYADRAKNRASEAGDFRDQAEEFQSQTEAFANTAKGYMDAAGLSATNAAESASASANSAKQALETKNGAVKDITETKENCLSELEQKTTDLLNSIPDDYSQMAETVKYHNDALTDLDTRVSNKMNSIYTSNLGESHITDCQDGDIRNLKMEGRTEQKQYQGYQLLDLSKIAQTTNEGITVERFGDTSIRVYGEPTITEGYIKFIFTDVIHAESIGVEDNFIIRVSEKQVGVGVTFESESSGAINLAMADTVTKKNKTCIIKTRKLAINVSYNVGAIDFTFDLQLEQGTEEHEYEPYVGGISSPNPDYPQEIKNVEQINVRVCGKNLWYIGDICQKSKTEIPIEIPKGEYYFSCNFNSSKSLSIRFNYTNGSSVLYGSPKSIILEHDVASLNWFVSDFVDNITEIQLEAGDTATDYEAYKEQTFAIIPPNPLNAIGDYKDICDVESGLWRYATKTYVVPTIELKQASSDSTFLTCGLSISKFNGLDASNMKITELISDKFRANNINENNVFRLNSSRNMILFYRAYTGETTEIVNNIAVLYPISGETEPINAEDLAKLRALQTYYGNTNIFITDQDGNDITTWFDYHFNLKPYVEYVKEQISDSKELIYDMRARQLDAEVSNAWSYINAEYAASLADFS